MELLPKAMKERAQGFHYILPLAQNDLQPGEGGHSVSGTPVWILPGELGLMTGRLVLSHLPAFPVIDGG